MLDFKSAIRVRVSVEPILTSHERAGDRNVTGMKQTVRFQTFISQIFQLDYLQTFPGLIELVSTVILANYVVDFGEKLKCLALAPKHHLLHALF